MFRWMKLELKYAQTLNMKAQTDIWLRLFFLIPFSIWNNPIKWAICFLIVFITYFIRTFKFDINIRMCFYSIDFTLIENIFLFDRCKCHHFIYPNIQNQFVTLTLFLPFSINRIAIISSEFLLSLFSFC